MLLRRVVVLEQLTVQRTHDSRDDERLMGSQITYVNGAVCVRSRPDWTRHYGRSFVRQILGRCYFGVPYGCQFFNVIDEEIFACRQRITNVFVGRSRPQAAHKLNCRP